jgi:hypothetical protein
VCVCAKDSVFSACDMRGKIFQTGGGGGSAELGLASLCWTAVMAGRLCLR